MNCEYNGIKLCIDGFQTRYVPGHRERFPCCICRSLDHAEYLKTWKYPEPTAECIPRPKAVVPKHVQQSELFENRGVEFL